MKEYLVIEKNLTPDIDEIYRLIDQYGEWVDGSVSFSGGDHIKKNNQIHFNNSNCIGKLSDIVYDRMDTHKSFHNFTAAKSSESPLITRTSVGGYYRPHHDFPENGDYSTTIFLNDDYEGGELCLWINDEEKKFKPSAGTSVTYKTGIPHRVNEVTKGHRDVIVFWTYSRIKDPFMMEIYQELTHALEYVYVDCSPHQTLYDSADCPHFIIQSLINSILRKSTN